MLVGDDDQHEDDEGTPTMCQYAENVLSIDVIRMSNTLISAGGQQEERRRG